MAGQVKNMAEPTLGGSAGFIKHVIVFFGSGADDFQSVAGPYDSEEEAFDAADAYTNNNLVDPEKVRYISVVPLESPEELAKSGDRKRQYKWQALFSHDYCGSVAFIFWCIAMLIIAVHLLTRS